MFRNSLALLSAYLISLTSSLPARAGDLAEARSVLAASVAVVEKMREDENFRNDINPYLERARAALIVPAFYKGGFILGAAYGHGVLTARNDQGRFSPPVFYTLAGGSIGLQIGGQRVQSLFLIMTEEGLESILSNQFKVGATAGISVATIGSNIEAATTSNLQQDILVFSHSQGAYGGGAIEGAGMTFHQEWTDALYKTATTPRMILFDRRYNLLEAKPLIEALSSRWPHSDNGELLTSQDHLTDSVARDQDFTEVHDTPTPPVQLRPSESETPQEIIF